MRVSVFIVIFFSVIAGFSLLKPGLPPTHDGEYHVIRFYEFDKALRDGNPYPRWAPDLNNGFGAPLFNYVYPFPNYVASFLHLFGFSFIDAFKLNLFFATIFSAIFFYLWTRMLWGDLGGVVSSIFYTFSPYRFLDIYIRGSVGEIWAMAFLPAFLWSITIFFKDKNLKYFILSSLFLTLIILSHNILGLMFFVFIGFYIIFLIYQSKEKKYFILNTLYLILLGLGLSSIFWLPALFENKFVTGLQIYRVSENFPDLYQLLIPSWGSGFSGQNFFGGMSFQIGIANLLGAILGFLSLIILLKRKDKRVGLIFFFFAAFIFVFFLMLKISLPVWKIIPMMSYFQFPWRFLSLEILIVSFLAGSIFVLWKNYILAGFLILLAVLLSINYAKPAYYHQRDDNYYISRSNFIDGTNSPGNYFNTIWFNKNLTKRKNKLESDNNFSILSMVTKSHEEKFQLKTDNEGLVILNTAYFPGWTLFINGNRKEISKTEDGRISFILPKGVSIVEILFLNTFIRNLAVFITIISIFIFMILFKKSFEDKK